MDKVNILFVLGLVVTIGLLRRQKSIRKRMKTAAAGTPWILRKDWKAGRCRAETFHGQDAYRIPLTILCVFFLFFVEHGWNRPQEKFNPKLLAWEIAVLAAGLYYCRRPILIFLRMLWFPRASLQLDTLPCVPGTTARGTLKLPVPRHQIRAGTLVLSCKFYGQRYTGGRRHSTKRIEETYFTQSFPISPDAISADAGGSLLQWEVPIPISDLPSPTHVGESRLRPDCSWVAWELAVNLDIPGLDYHQRFELPVFKGIPT